VPTVTVVGKPIDADALREELRGVTLRGPNAKGGANWQNKDVIRRALRRLAHRD